MKLLRNEAPAGVGGTLNFTSCEARYFTAAPPLLHLERPNFKLLSKKQTKPAIGWNYCTRQITQEECTAVDTEFVSYQEIHQQKRLMEIKEIAVDCANGERYFIDGVSINSDLRNALSELSKEQRINLLIHPNSNTIVEFSTDNSKILTFDETIGKLGGEATA